MDYRLELTLWVLLSMALYAGWWNFHHYVVEPGRWRIGNWLQRRFQRPAVDVALECGAALYYLGVPFAALIRGVALPRLAGLSNLDWVHGAASAVALGAVFLVLMGLVEVYALRVGRRYGISVEKGKDFFQCGKEALFLQAHWAFYRTLTVTWMGMRWGTLLGLLLPLMEWLLTPRGRRLLEDVQLACRATQMGGLAVTSAVIFLYSRNLLFAFLYHWLTGWGIGKLRRA